MAATVIQPTYARPAGNAIIITVSIPTTVDGAAGATCAFQLYGASAIVWSAISSNFNGKTVELKASLDGTNFFGLAVANSLTASGNKIVPAIECPYPQWQMSITGAPLAAMVVTLAASV